MDGMAVRRSLPRPLWALLLVALLLPGVLDLHPAGEQHEPLAAGVQGVYYPEAAHPDQPIHLEQGSPVKVPPCLACLHRLETSGVHLREVARVAPPVPQAPVGCETGPLPVRTASRPSAARAPPSLT